MLEKRDSLNCSFSKIRTQNAAGNFSLSKMVGRRMKRNWEEKKKITNIFYSVDMCKTCFFSPCATLSIGCNLLILAVAQIWCTQPDPTHLSLEYISFILSCVVLKYFCELCLHNFCLAFINLCMFVCSDVNTINLKMRFFPLF